MVISLYQLVIYTLLLQTASPDHKFIGSFYIDYIMNACRSMPYAGQAANNIGEAGAECSGWLSFRLGPKVC